MYYPECSYLVASCPLPVARCHLPATDLESGLDSWKQAKELPTQTRRIGKWTYRANHWERCLDPEELHPLFHFDGNG